MIRKAKVPPIYFKFPQGPQYPLARITIKASNCTEWPQNGLARYTVKCIVCTMIIVWQRSLWSVLTHTYSAPPQPRRPVSEMRKSWRSPGGVTHTNSLTNVTFDWSSLERHEPMNQCNNEWTKYRVHTTIGVSEHGEYACDVAML